MKTIIATTLAGMLAMGAGAAFAQQTPPPTEPQTMRPMRPRTAQNSCASQFPTFSQLDVKNQGQITKQEASQAPQLERAFKKADTNHNGKLSQTEYAKWVEKQCSHGVAR